MKEESGLLVGELQLVDVFWACYYWKAANGYELKRCLILIKLRGLPEKTEMYNVKNIHNFMHARR